MSFFGDDHREKYFFLASIAKNHKNELFWRWKKSLWRAFFPSPKIFFLASENLKKSSPKIPLPNSSLLLAVRYSGNDFEFIAQLVRNNDTLT